MHTSPTPYVFTFTLLQIPISLYICTNTQQQTSVF